VPALKIIFWLIAFINTTSASGSPRQRAGGIETMTATSSESLIVPTVRAEALKGRLREKPSWYLTGRQECDLELLLNGALAPLRGFLGRSDYEAVCSGMRLADGSLWPMPITLDVTEELATSLETGDQVALRHPEGFIVAALTIGDIWEPDRRYEAEQVFGTTDPVHPGVDYLLNHSHSFYVGGIVEGVELPPHHTYRELRHTPAELRSLFRERGWERIVAFQTRNPLHRAHFELTKRAAEQADAKLLLHPVVGRTSPDDLDYFVRVRCYKAVLPQYPDDSAMLSLLPLAMRMGGPREALWHALIRRNYGATHFIVGRDHAGPRDAEGKPFYHPDAARELVREHQTEAGIELVEFEEMVYNASADAYVPRSELPAEAVVLNLSGTELRRKLRSGEVIPAWFSYPEVITALRQSFPPRNRQGYTVFFTGLSGSGKSTVAQTFMAMLMEEGSRPVTLLDGDIVRTNLSSELGFSREHRDLNIQRIGFVASEITKNCGAAICAPIAPYRSMRRQVRKLIERYGGFIQVHIATPLEVCERRDRKGLYAKARAGLIKGFTGIDDPYEVPERAEVVIDTTDIEPDESARMVLQYLIDQGYLVARP